MEISSRSLIVNKTKIYLVYFISTFDLAEAGMGDERLTLKLVIKVQKYMHIHPPLESNQRNANNSAAPPDQLAV